MLAEQGIPSGKLVTWVMIGGSLGAGGANALNHYLERDLDKKMLRTRRRPVASDRIEPQKGLDLRCWTESAGLHNIRCLG